MSDRLPSTRIRWWPAAAIIAFAGLAWFVVPHLPARQEQTRSMILLVATLVSGLLLVLWWLFASRAPRGLRFGAFAVFLVIGGALGATFRFRGVTGDFIPIVESRWSKRAAAVNPAAAPLQSPALTESGRPDFPQYLGAHRNGVIDKTPALARNWQKQPPQVVWRQPIGPAWSGFAIVGNRAVTFEQRNDQEAVVCLDVLTGNRLWERLDPARYASPLGGEGPRSTPTIQDGRVYTFGATGILNCLDLATGRLLWQRTMAADAPGALPDWGYAGSPLVHNGLVIVSAGNPDGKSLLAYRLADGAPSWQKGTRPALYASPALATLASQSQIVCFNMAAITSHDATTGEVLWEYPWGNRQPCVAQPVPVGPDQIVFSSGYGIGCELLQIQKDAAGKFTTARQWKSLSLKAKMASFVHRDGFLYGLDDGILTCVDAKDGRRKWKAGRYGHGQILLIDDLLLVTAESGDVVLLAPTPEAPNELGTFKVFDAKTWNPPAISGDLLLMRTDQEAACVRLPVVGS